MKRASRRHAIEPLGLVLQRDPTMRVPASVEISPVSARDWEAAVGTRIAARARPGRIERGVLHVRTATATWAQELGFLAEPILAQLRARGIAVDALRFRVGLVEAPERPPWRSEVRTTPPEVPLPADVGAELARVADPELREAIARAAAKNLGWQATREPRPASAAKQPARARPSPQAPPTSPSAAPAPRSGSARRGPSGRTSTTSPAAP